MSEEQSLWNSLLRRDTAAFEQLYSQHGSPVRRFLFVYLGNSAVADDLTQETFLQIWRSPAAFDPSRSKIRAYLLGIARKKAAEWWRRHKQVAEIPERALGIPGDSSSAIILNALNQLAPDSRDILWLREVEGYSYEELAGILHIPAGTVRSRLHNAREQLRELWNSGKENA